MKNLKPLFIENSVVPKILSYLSPIDIWAIALGPLVFCRGKLQPQTRRHETIHFQQQLELLFLGFFLLYVVFWLRALVKTKSGSEAYRVIPFEIEAYSNESNEEYLRNRKRFAWIKYLK
tara:strand:+ start:11343 stop:11699 length:357 start_codon:yes stop_codon:yes gene_type:complete